MKAFITLFSAALMLLASMVQAEQGKPQKLNIREKKESGQILNYRPPAGSIGRPAVRVGGATRGSGDISVSITALAPEHTGLTLSAAPSLCWYLSGKAKTKLGITINDEKSAAPLFEKEFEGDSDAGIYCLNLADYNVTLRPGVEYQWFAAIIHDARQRSRDVVSSGMIMLMVPERQLAGRLDSARTGLEKAGIYASEGIWYDAVSLLSSMIRQNPKDRELLSARAGLLRQAGLKAAAEHDLKE